MSHLRLCKKSDGVANLVDIDVLLDTAKADPHPVTYQPWTDVPGDDNLGAPIRAGYPLARWHWDWLPQPDVDILLGYEGSVYVRTDKRTGTIREHATFEATLVISDIGEPIRFENGIPDVPQARGPVDVEFRMLVEQ